MKFIRWRKRQSPADPNDFLASLGKQAEEVFKQVEAAATVFSVATAGPCPVAENGKHKMCAHELSTASLVVPSVPAMGVEVAVSGCLLCQMLILQLAPYNHPPAVKLMLQGCVIKPHEHKG